ncbi:hypothetical protein [Dolosigranulum pigrum]|uniref:hypothetical protein n=1 Tax=Dolosigranulum pigrum TaxID=29394 RepID=UPI001AD857DB|nr:hypothetical protein [Dolosigranulum pigrum]QTJ57143.1 hypothetical protein FE335_06340 [Dolosigranulum pigrum]
MLGNINVSRNANKLISDIKQQPHSVWISTVMYIIAAVDIVLLPAVGINSFWGGYLDHSIFGFIYTMVMIVMLPPNPVITFNIWSKSVQPTSSSSQPHSKPLGKWLAMLYLVYMMVPLTTPGEALGMIWIDFVIIIIFGILAMGLIRFDFRSDTSEIDI